MNRAGFTVIEVIIYTALLSIGLAALVFVYLAGVETHSLVETEQKLLDVRRVVELTVRSRLEEAVIVLVPESGSTNQLVISSPNPLEDPITFAVSNNAFTMQLGAAAPITLTPGDVRVTNFTATRLSGAPPSVEISLTFEADAAKATVTSTSTFTMTLRYD
jgi:hypothetical protein